MFTFACTPARAARNWAAPTGTTRQKEAFLRQQWGAQTASTARTTRARSSWCWSTTVAPSGGLFLHRRTDEIRLVDIALLPEAAWSRARANGALECSTRPACRGRRCASTSSASIGAAPVRAAGLPVLEDRGVYLFLDVCADRGARASA